MRSIFVRFEPTVRLVADAEMAVLLIVLPVGVLVHFTKSPIELICGELVEFQPEVCY
jgi:hypothetical protein